VQPGEPSEGEPILRGPESADPVTTPPGPGYERDPQSENAAPLTTNPPPER
jgi:hypothetical protein